VPPFPAYLPMPQDMPGEGIGHFFGAMRIDAFRPAEDFKNHMDRWIARFKNADTAAGFDTVVIPGEPELALEDIHKKHGLNLLPAVVNDLTALAKQFAIDL
jgi:L-2-hydroxycarboxylate dehydrogenase (NAD+)